jgi:hypothetical protein
MSWQTEISTITRVWINDLSDTPTYSDTRLLQLILVAAKYVKLEVNLKNDYAIDLNLSTITPDPTEISDEDFVAFVALKSACLLDHSTFRTKAANEGIRAALGPASLSVGGNLAGYETILNQGPCSLYEQLKMDYELGNTDLFKVVLGPFSGNQFDPEFQGSKDRNSHRSGFYS